MAQHRFSGVLEAAGRDGGHWVVVPFDVRTAFGEARPPVKGTVNGAPFRSRLAVYGGITVLGLTRAVQTAAGIAAGDTVAVVIDRDDAPREVDLPPDLRDALAANPTARNAFEQLSFTARRELARSVAEAKRPETRERRLAAALDGLLAPPGRRRPPRRVARRRRVVPCCSA